MKIFFYFLSIVLVITSTTAVIHNNPMRSLLYLIITILGVSTIFFITGSEFAGALEIIIYAGAIMILFVFILMLLNVNTKKINMNNHLNFLLFIIFIMLLILSYNIINLNDYNLYLNNVTIDDKKIGIKLFGPYLIIVELVSILLLTSLIIVAHIGKKY